MLKGDFEGCEDILGVTKGAAEGLDDCEGTSLGSTEGRLDTDGVLEGTALRKHAYGWCRSGSAFVSTTPALLYQTQTMQRCD